MWYDMKNYNSSKKEEKQDVLYLVNTGILNDDSPESMEKTLKAVSAMFDRLRIDVLEVNKILPDVFEYVISRSLPWYLTNKNKGSYSSYYSFEEEMGDWTLYGGNDDIEVPLYWDQFETTFYFTPSYSYSRYSNYFEEQNKKVPTYTLDEKLLHKVYTSGEYVFLRIPEDTDFIRREGIDMQHCLSVAYTSYCDRMKKGEIELYSMINKDGKAEVDIEVAITIPSYNRKEVTQSSVTQIRGPRNQCPPNDELIPALIDFFNVYGKERQWQMDNHEYKNFDNRVDGDLLTKRFLELQGKEKAKTNGSDEV